ncbi:MAG: polyribonucleotide nucleotidyltransferase [Thermoanaerobaculia bacterium]|nr:polyribonucleotide nucleotidyltransferase [Thermoanaerobaculia bacterium]
MKESVSALLGGRPLTIENGKIAKQADGSAVVRLGDTMVLVTACYSRDPRDVDFVPLTVEYKEYQYAAGRIPGGFFKREGRPTEKEILTCRMIDRPIRPLFPEGWNFETQIVALVLSADGENDPDILAINGTAAALALNPIAFTAVLGGVRVGRIGDRFVFNPTKKEREESTIDLVVVGTRDAVSMVEAGSKEVSEELMLEAILAGHAELQKVIDAIEELQRRQGVVKQPFTSPAPVPADIMAEVRRRWDAPMMEALTWKGKIESYAKIKAVKKAAVAEVPDDQPELKAQVKRAMSDLVEVMTRETILRDRKRLDGRAFEEVRPIEVEVGVLPRTHGSSLFTRGETQALVTVTLGTSDDTQLIEDLEGEFEKKFLLHYNFPPFSVGEVKRFGTPGRREIGHGRLAWRALDAVLPREFPYTIRIVSDILESNGSSSMATICGGSLSLMDAGVPLESAVAGVAMGLVKEGEAWAVLTDIAGQEDHYGDMDFKVAGTRKGITALQMDIKISGIDRQIFEKALDQAKAGRLHILDIMEKGLPSARPEISAYAPRLLTIHVPEEKIRDVIGSGGKTIRALQKEYSVKIDVQDDGSVTVASVDMASAEKCIEAIRALTTVPEIGTEYEGTVKRVEPYGAFVEILPGLDGLVHISELAPGRVRETTDVVKLGDKAKVKIIAIDPVNGKIKLSRRQALTPEEAAAEVERLGLNATPVEGEGGGDDRPPFRREGGFGHRDRGPRRDGGGFGGPRGPRRDGPGGPPRR